MRRDFGDVEVKKVMRCADRHDLNFPGMRTQKPSTPWNLVAIALAVAGLFVGCGDDSSTSSNPGSVVSATLPSGWTLKENFPIAVGVAADYVYYAPPNSGFSANMLLLTTPASGMSPASAMASEIASARSNTNISGFEVDSNSVATVGGKEGYRVQFRYGQYLNGTWIYVLQRQLLVVHKGKDCQMVFTRLQSDSIVGAAALRSIEASLTLN